MGFSPAFDTHELVGQMGGCLDFHLTVHGLQHPRTSTIHRVLHPPTCPAGVFLGGPGIAGGDLKHGLTWRSELELRMELRMERSVGT